MPSNKELLIGCGSRRKKDLYVKGREAFEGLVTLDNNANHKPDVVHDLTVHPLPFDDNTFDEIHAYEVLEHLADQGDYEFFFAEFTEYWRILKPGGAFLASVPAPESIWVWGDPSHKRCINRATLVYLEQRAYAEQVGKTKISDFRHIYKADFARVWQQERPDGFYFILKAIKNGRI